MKAMMNARTSVIVKVPTTQFSIPNNPDVASNLKVRAVDVVVVAVVLIAVMVTEVVVTQVADPAVVVGSFCRHF